MNWKTWALLALALVLGFGAAYGVKAIFFDDRSDSEIADDASRSGALERALVANGDVLSGMELTAQNVRFVLMPEQEVPRDGIVSFNGMSGRVVTRDLKDGEPISLYDLEEPREASATSSVFVPPGYVVVPIEICSVSKETGSLNYLKTTKLDKIVKPGDVVDISVAKEDRRNGAVGLRRLVTETLARDVSVFSVTDEKRFGSDGSGRYSCLSALLSTEQVELIRKAYGEGKLKLTLRNGTEEEAPMELFSTGDSAAVVPIRNNDGRPWQTPRSTVAPTMNENFIIGGVPETVPEPEKETEVEPEPTLVEPESVIAINNGFFLGGESESDASALIDPEASSEVDQIANDASSLVEEDELQRLDETPDAAHGTAQWSRVNFDNPTPPALDSSTLPAINESWTGEPAFRDRSQDATARRSTNSERYNLATSQTQVADPTVVEGDEHETTAPTSNPAGTAISGGDSNPTDVPKVNAVKKVSPFITTPAKTAPTKTTTKTSRRGR